MKGLFANYSGTDAYTDATTSTLALNTVYAYTAKADIGEGSEITSNGAWFATVAE